MEVIFPGDLVQLRDRGLNVYSRMLHPISMLCVFPKEHLYGVVLAMTSWKDVDDNMRKSASHALDRLQPNPREFVDLHGNETTYVILISIHEDIVPLFDKVNSYVNEIVIVPNDQRFAAVLKTNA